LCALSASGTRHHSAIFCIERRPLVPTPVAELEQSVRVRHEANMAALNPLLTKVFRGPLDLNGPIIGRIFYLFEYARSYVEERLEAFDARFGTDTSAPTFERHQKTDVHFYVPTTASIIYSILSWLPIEPNRFDFIDMGSGKGRALLVASEFPFSKIVGVELSEALHRVAEDNVKLYKPASQKCTDFDLKCMDALEYTYDDNKPLVLYLFDPFGREILEQVVAKLEASLREHPRTAYVVYVYPQYDDVLERSHILQKVTKGGPRWQPWSQYVIYAASLAAPVDMQTARAETTVATTPAKTAA
jgi:SAM-dependent methyltransferase